MYESFYGLDKKPFQITTDPGFLWMGRKHREALATLKYGVMDNKGFLLLTGDVGTGKTTLINRLVEDIKDKAYTAKIPDPGLSKYDFYRMVARYFGLPIEVRTKSDFLEPFSRFLNDARQERKSVLLLIDEAQRLKHDLMEEIRLLSNLEREESKLLNIFFIGQNEFNATLLQPENRALLRRIMITYNIDPLDEAETGEYIRHRLKIAGAGYEIFSSAATAEVFAFSGGFPRQINIICDLALFFASQVAQRTINRQTVRQCRERLSFRVDEAPTETADNIRAPAPAAAHRPAVSRRPQRIVAWCLGAMALLLLMTAGAAFAPKPVKQRAADWVHTTYRAVFPIRTEPPATAAPVAESVPSVSDSSTTDRSASRAPNDDPILRLPRQPMAVALPGPSSPRVGDPAAASASKTVPVDRSLHRGTEAVPEPGAAIDWLLKQRKQGNDF